MDENRCRWALGVSEMKFETIRAIYQDFIDVSVDVNRNRLQCENPKLTEKQLNEVLRNYNAGYFAAFDELKECIGINEFIKLIKKLDPDHYAS
jgi:hypothetical protein